MKCICKTKTCTKCPINTYSEGDINPICTACKPGEVTNSEQSKCYGVNDLFSEIKQDLTAQKEKQNDLSIKNSRLWAKEQIRLEAPNVPRGGPIPYKLKNLGIQKRLKEREIENLEGQIKNNLQMRKMLEITAFNKASQQRASHLQQSCSTARHAAPHVCVR